MVCLILVVEYWEYNVSVILYEYYEYNVILMLKGFSDEFS